ncbi:hypothetical protein M3212_13165 [Alkalihalobacillus oceani]|uniref:hypothetical protein n=1 Tax=Halalkalibacter oceani TaxID=1653776 RepID=UPI00203B8259|nr:hypothetical protein [Halalkalibacter oceani]MCM3761722.1 hypothetical protein [Halalkalibacter oceani]
MTYKKIVAAAILTSTFGLAGCASDIAPENIATATEEEQLPINEETASTTEQVQESDISETFEEMLLAETPPSEVAAYLQQHLSDISPEDVSVMVQKFEQHQQTYLPRLEEKFHDSEIQIGIHEQFGFTLPTDEEFEEVENAEVAALLSEMKENGYKLEMAEGMYFPIIDYRFYNPFTENAAADTQAYIELMIAESDQVPAKDAALVISWESIVQRAVNQEEFLNGFPQSGFASEVADLYETYIMFLLYGLNNTPLFDYDSHTIDSEALAAFSSIVENVEDSETMKLLDQYLTIIEVNNNQLTDEVEQFRTDYMEALQEER